MPTRVKSSSENHSLVVHVQSEAIDRPLDSTIQFSLTQSISPHGEVHFVERLSAGSRGDGEECSKCLAPVLFEHQFEVLPAVCGGCDAADTLLELSSVPESVEAGMESTCYIDIHYAEEFRLGAVGSANHPLMSYNSAENFAADTPDAMLYHNAETNVTLVPRINELWVDSSHRMSVPVLSLGEDDLEIDAAPAVNTHRAFMIRFSCDEEMVTPIKTSVCAAMSELVPQVEVRALHCVPMITPTTATITDIIGIGYLGQLNFPMEVDVDEDDWDFSSSLE